MQNKVSSRQAKSCFRNAESILTTAVSFFKTDGVCLRERQDEVKKLMKPLIDELYQYIPTPACPIPIICNIGLTSFKMKNIRIVTRLLSNIKEKTNKLLELIVYFKRDVQRCRLNTNRFEEFVNSVRALSISCLKL
ncbi:hypothetical protein HHI36_011856 [Cryptolaemus montrouzieri]|uniref:Uncharacterized protein n=1 Tax=Cryptolaemus montrouzieri TaxID=559131 RepID=A0ABD2NDA5_9CUCU